MTMPAFWIPNGDVRSANVDESSTAYLEVTGVLGNAEHNKVVGVPMVIG